MSRDNRRKAARAASSKNVALVLQVLRTRVQSPMASLADLLHDPRDQPDHSARDGLLKSGCASARFPHGRSSAIASWHGLSSRSSRLSCCWPSAGSPSASCRQHRRVHKSPWMACSAHGPGDGHGHRSSQTPNSCPARSISSGLLRPAVPLGFVPRPSAPRSANVAGLVPDHAASSGPVYSDVQRPRGPLGPGPRPRSWPSGAVSGR